MDSSEKPARSQPTNTQQSEYSGDELAAMYGLSRTLAYRRKAAASSAGVNMTRTDDRAADKARMEHAFVPRYRKNQVQHYVCKECGLPNVQGSGRKRTACLVCLPDASARNRYFKFRITEPQFLALFQAQGGSCGICNKTLTHDKVKGSKTYACIDHCHVTGQVRGLLCPACNTRLSGVEDPNWLEKAMEWLKKKEGMS